MSKLETLIQQLCPNGVEYKKIDEVAECLAGATPKTSIPAYWENGTIPWMSSGEVNNKVIYKTGAKITQKGYESCSTKMVPPNTVVVALAGQGKTRGAVAITRIELCTNQSLCSIITTSELLPDFLYHYLNGQYNKLRDISSGDGTRGGLNLKMIKNFLVPVPPLEVQREIVRILDNFTELTTELTAELTARKKQYEYYRDRLLAFDVRGEGTSNVVWRTFGEVATIVRGASPRPIQSYITDDENGVPWIKIGDVPVGSKYITGTAEKITEEGSKKSRHINPGDFVLSNSMSFGRPYISKIHGCIHDGWLSISNFEDSFVPDFLYHLLSSTTIQNTLAQKASRGTVQNLNADIVKSLELPIPPFDVQNRIAKVLDNFETICSDLNIGLPAEIEARKKQYEYYRDKLLTFKPLA